MDLSRTGLFNCRPGKRGLKEKGLGIRVAAIDPMTRGLKKICGRFR